ncbi:MAG: polysaccharide deacetylase family protein [Rhizobiales bacterium]|nr:polysaccharide deacetylase family protein [Hyphomicrobiales bacterium]
MRVASLLKSTFPIVARCSGLGSALALRYRALRYRGAGTIFMLHSVVDCGDDYPDHSLRCPAETLTAALTWLREAGVDFVSLDEMLERLIAPSERPFAAFTFDDGFADSLTHALPVMERFNAPMTVYVATGMILRSMDAWWLGLAAWIRANDRIALPAAGLAFDCADPAGKKRAFVAIEAVIHHNYELLPNVRAAIAAQGIYSDSLVDREALTIAQLRELSRHPLVTIGGHGDTHINLARASDDTAYREMMSNRRFLEELIGRPVEHFAYPFGNARACGNREAEFARSVGFRTAVTTRSGAVFPAHLDHPYALPREVLSANDTPSSLRCKLDGVYRAIQSQLGDPIALM